MKIEFSIPNTNVACGLLPLKEGVFSFSAISPVTIQPSEIMKVPINSILKIEKVYVLLITSSQFIVDKVCQIFPSVITLDHSSNSPLIIPIMNCGRNPQYIMPGNVVAVGRIFRSEGSVEEVELDLGKPTIEDLPRTKAQKKNSDIAFELK